MHRLWYATCWKIFDLIWPLMVKGLKIIYHIVYLLQRNNGHSMHRFWDISLNRSLRPKLDLSDLKNYHDFAPYHFRTGLVSHQISYMIQYILAALHYHWIILIIMGNGPNPTFPTLKMTFRILQSNISLNSGSIYTTNMLSDRFWEI